jgi:hypothetical protein
MLSKRAPVFQNRLNQTPKESSQAVIRFAIDGTSNTLSSSSVRVHVKAAMRPPALVPEITRGSSPASKKALTTPKWSVKCRLIMIQR